MQHKADKKKIAITFIQGNISEMYQWALVYTNGQALPAQLVYFLNLESGYVFLTKEQCCPLVENDKRVKRGLSVEQSEKQISSSNVMIQ